MATTIKYSELNAWLASQAVNTSSTPYEIIVTELTDADLEGGRGNTLSSYKGLQKVLIDNSTKYVAIKDLQGSVTTISRYAFYKCTSLTSIEIPNGVTSIGNESLENCTSLTSVIIPDSVTSIGYSIFLGCTSLTSVVIGNSVASISNMAFYNCRSLTSVVIPDSVTSIETQAFDSCSSLTSIIIPNGVTSIGNSAFYECESLTSIEIPNSITSIGDNAFNSCYSLASVVIPNGITSIGYQVFRDCFSLTSIEIPDSVTSIGSWAFGNCNLTSIEIPNGVTSIGSWAFEGCDRLQYIYDYYLPTKAGKTFLCKQVPSDTTEFTIRNDCIGIAGGAFYICDNLTSIEIPDSVTSIGDFAFASCTSLTSIIIPNGVIFIGDSAFADCLDLASIKIPNSVTSIGSNTFYNCQSLTSIEIGNSVTSIGDYAFNYCSSLTSIEIPESVTEIGEEILYGCRSLTNIKIYGNPDVWDSFTGVSTNFIVNPEVWTQGYSTDFGGATISIFYDFDGNLLTPITPATLSSCLSFLPENTVDTPYEITITEVTNTDLEGDDVTPKNIQKAIKDNITKFVSIKVEGEVTAIGDSAFADCTNLVAFEIPNTVTILGKGAFYNTGITEITVPGSVTEMDCYYLFAECTYLRKITFNNGEISPTNVGSMFQECINLKEVNLLWLNTENVTDYSDMFVNDTIDVYVNHYIWTLGTDDPQFSNATEITWHDVRLEMEITDGIEDSEVYYGVVKVLRVNAIANFGGAVITYQWYKNNILMETVTGNSFTYVALEDGTYKCVVTATLSGDSVTKTTEGTITVVPYYDEGTKIIVHGSQTVRGDIFIHGEIQGDFMKSILDRIEALEQRN